MLVLALLILTGGYTGHRIHPLLGLLSTTIGSLVSLLVVGTIIFVTLDKKSRTLISYMYKSAMRWLTGLLSRLIP